MERHCKIFPHNILRTDDDVDSNGSYDDTLSKKKYVTLGVYMMTMKPLTTSKLDLLSKRFLLPRLAWCLSIKLFFVCYLLFLICYFVFLYLPRLPWCVSIKLFLGCYFFFLICHFFVLDQACLVCVNQTIFICYLLFLISYTCPGLPGVCQSNFYFLSKVDWADSRMVLGL